MGLKRFVKSVVSAPVTVAKAVVDTGTSVVKETVKTVGTVANLATDVVETVVDQVVKPVAQTVVNTIDYALKNPVDAAVMIAASSGPWAPWAVPAASAAIAVSHGGDLEDAAKAAAVAYATQEFMTSTDVGKDIGAYTKTAGAEAGAYTGFEAPNAAIVSKGVTSALNQAVVGGMKSVLTGQDIGAGITSGLTSGAIFGSTDQYFANLNKSGDLNFTDDPKLNAKIAKSMGAVAGTALSAAVQGKDPAVAIGNYLTYAMIDTAGTGIASAAKSAYKDMTASLNAAQESQKTLSERQAEYNRQFADLDKRQEDYNASVSAYQNKIASEWNPVQDSLAAQKTAYDSALAKYKEQEAIYNDTSKSVAERNAAASKMETYANQTADASRAYDKIMADNKGLYDTLNSTGANLSKTKTSLDTDFASLQDSVGKSMIEAKNDLDKKLEEYNQAKAAADETNKAYETQIAETATRNIAIDAINQGLAAPTQTNADGSVTFDNGITVTTDGKFLQDGKQIFSTASDVAQNDLRFSNESGKNYWFDNKAARLASDTDIQDLYKNNYGLDIDAEKAKEFAGTKFNEANTDKVKDYALDTISSEFEKYGYKAPDVATLESYIQKSGDTINKVNEVIDPYYTDTEEAKNFIRSTLNREGTPEEIALLVGTKAESETMGAKSKQEAELYETLKNLFGEAQTAGYGFGTEVAGPGSLAGALPVRVFASEAGMPLTGETASEPVEVDGIWRREVTGKTTDGKDYSYEITFDPSTQKLRYETSGFIDPENPVFGQTSISATRPQFAEGDPQLGSLDERTEAELFNNSLLKSFLESSINKDATTGTTGGSTAGGTTGGTSGGTTTGGSAADRLIQFPLGSGATGATGTTGSTTGSATGAGTGVGTGTGVGAGTGAGAGAGTGAGTGAGGTGTGGGGTGTGTGATTPTTPKPATSSGSFGDLTSYMTGALMLGALPNAASTITPLKPSLLTSKDPGTRFEGALSEFQQLASRPFYDENTYAEQFVKPEASQEDQQIMNTPYYSYGEIDDISDIMNPTSTEEQTAAHGGLMTTPLMAAGGMTGTRHGMYAHGGLSTPIVHHSGKARVDFRHGDAVTGAGDGQSDDIPAMLADGEFVFPADVVAAIGNGSTKAGSDKLYDMMHGIRAHVRSAKPKDLPPVIKSPLDFLKAKPKKARRK